MMGAGPFRADEPEILSIFAIGQSVDDAFQLHLIDEIHSVGDFLKAGNFQSLPMFDCRDVIPRFEQTGLRPRIEPGHSAAERLYMQFVLLKINRVEVGDLQFPARGWPELPAELNYA